MKRIFVGIVFIYQVCLAETNLSVHECSYDAEETLLVTTLVKKSDASVVDILLIDITGDVHCEAIVINQTEDNVWFSVYRLDGSEAIEVTMPDIASVNDIAPGISSVYATKAGLFLPFAKFNGEFVKGVHLYFAGENTLEVELGKELSDMGEVVFESASP